jgi:VWFA-related protein
MFHLRSACSVLLLGNLLSITPATSQEPAAQDAPTPGEHRLQVTSSLVFLDVTVVDKQGKPVTKGLTKDDFVITEEREKQRIFSFEQPEEHIAVGEDQKANKAPITIFVFDELNTPISDFAYLRQETRNYIASLPAELPAPAEMMVIGNNSLELMQGFTRSREELLFALDHLPPVIPFKLSNGDFSMERVQQSIDALQQIALQNKGVAGKKNILWIGQGSPGVGTNSDAGKTLERFNQYLHETVNMLTDARATLSVVFPTPKLERRLARGATADSIDSDSSRPFAGTVNFANFAHETGGRLYYNRNDIDSEITEAEELGSNYYTLTYQPNEAKMDGRFRHIHVSLRDPNLRVVTKTGYYSLNKDRIDDTRQQATSNIAEAARASIPLNGVPMVLFRVVHLEDSRAAVVTLQIPTKDLVWQTGEDGKSRASMVLAAVSKSGNSDILASKVEQVNIAANSIDESKLGTGSARVSIQVQVPRRTRDLRVVVQLEGKGTVGSVDVSKQVLDSAPVASVKAQLSPASKNKTSPL